MNNTTSQTREQKLEAALLQFIKMVAAMRRAQTDFDTHFGSERRAIKHSHQGKVDAALATMGVTDGTDLRELEGIEIVRE